MLWLPLKKSMILPTRFLFSSVHDNLLERRDYSSTAKMPSVSSLNMLHIYWHQKLVFLKRMRTIVKILFAALGSSSKQWLRIKILMWVHSKVKLGRSDSPSQLPSKVTSLKSMELCQCKARVWGQSSPQSLKQNFANGAVLMQKHRMAPDVCSICSTLIH